MKSKTPLIVLALIVLAILAFALGRPSAGDPYETFSLALDRLAGPGGWSAQSHEANSDGLSVTGLSLTLPARLSGAPEGRPATLTIDSVLVKNPLPKAKLEKILAAGDWRNQPEVALADALSLKGLRHQTVLEDEAEAQASFDEVHLSAPRLAAAGAEAPAGPAGFIKALRLAGFSYKNFQLAVKGAEAEAAASVAAGDLESLAFDGETPPALAELDPSGQVSALGGVNFKSLKANGLNMEFAGLADEAKVKFSLGLGALEETDLKGFKSLGFFRLTDLKASLTDAEGKTSTFSLADFNYKGLDLGAYLDRYLPGLVLMKTDREQAQEKLAEAWTLADLFVSPISLENASLTGLKMSLMDGLVSINLKEYSVPGPYRAGEIPRAFKWILKGLEITLPETAAEESPGKELYEFAQEIGHNRFVVEAEAEGLYDPRTGSYTIKLNDFGVQDLFNFSMGMSYGGLTPARLEKLGQVNLSAPYLALMSPQDILGDASLEAFSLKYADHGLADFIFKRMAEEKGGGLTAKTLRNKMAAELDLSISVMGSKYIKNAADLSAPLFAFLKDSQSLEISLKAEPPLSFPAAQKMGDQAALLDSLNLTVSANGKAGAPLKFVADEERRVVDPGLEAPEDEED